MFHKHMSSFKSYTLRNARDTNLNVDLNLGRDCLLNLQSRKLLGQIVLDISVSQ